MLKLMLAGVALRPGCTPVPEMLTVALVPCVLTKATLPLAAPEEVGWNLTFNEILCEGTKVTGVAMPLAEKSEPLTLIREIVTLALPVFDTLTLCDAALPALMLPKLTLDGLVDIANDAVVPVPLRVMAAGEFGALLTSERLPFRLPAAHGVNCKLKLPV